MIIYAHLIISVPFYDNHVVEGDTLFTNHCGRGQGFGEMVNWSRDGQLVT